MPVEKQRLDKPVESAYPRQYSCDQADCPAGHYSLFIIFDFHTFVIVTQKFSSADRSFPCKKKLQALRLATFFAERQVLETIIKYIIIMMLHFVLYILIYSTLSSI